MPEQQADTYLRPFIRYQRILIHGGGVLVTLAILAAFAFHMVSMVERYIARERHDLAFDLQRIGHETAQIDAILRNNALNGELMWHRGAMPPDADVDQFFRDDRVFSLPSHPTILVIGITSGTIGRAQVAQMIKFAVNMAPLLDVIAARRGERVSAYAVSADRTLAVLSLHTPLSGADLARLVPDRQVLGRQLTNQLPAATAEHATDNTAPGLRLVEWLNPSSDWLTGLPVIRLATRVNDSRGRKAPLLDVIVEFPAQLVTTTLPQGRFNGAFAVLAKGDVIASTASDAMTRIALERALQTLPTWSPDGSVAWSRGSMMIRERFGTTNWSLVYVVPWRTIVGELDASVIATSATSLGIIALIWILLWVFDHNVSRPTLAAAIRVSESEHLSRVLINTAPVGLSLIDVDTTASLLQSPTMIELEATMATRPDKSAAALVHHYEHARQRLTHTDESWQSSVVTDTLTIERVGAAPMKAALRTVPARFQGRNVLVVTLTDVTTEHELQTKLVKARHAAEAANAAKSAFLATTSHEIRTPLHAMLGNLDLLARSAVDTSQRDRLDIIQAAGQQLVRIIDDILDLSKIESGDMQYENIAFDIVALIEDALTLYLPNAQLKSLTFLYITREIEPRWLMGDPSRIAQIIRNLLSNAIKFTDRGKVVVTLNISSETDSTSPAAVQLCVEDTGIGIETEHQVAIFDAFRQVDGTVTRRFGGTGLGLSLCKRLTAGMGGSITVDSTPGTGSRFCVCIPAFAASQRASDQRAGSLAHKTVALTTAAPEWIEHVTYLLTHWGAEIKVIDHPDKIDANSIRDCDAVILWGDRSAWTSTGEDNILEAAQHMIVATPDGPSRPARTPCITSISCYTIDGLYMALRELDGFSPDEALVPRGAVCQGKWEPLGLSVLVVDDNPANRQLTVEQLHILGCDVHAVNNGVAALNVLSSRVFDMVITDLTMPDMTGIQLAQAIRRFNSSLVVLLLTANPASDELARAKTSGIERTLVKPIGLDGLFDTLQQYTPAPRLPDAFAAASESNPTDPSVTLEQMFASSIAHDLTRLRDSYQAHDVDGMRDVLHSLKGCLGAFGFEAFAIEICTLERQLDGPSSVVPPLDPLRWADTVEQRIVKPQLRRAANTRIENIHPLDQGDGL